MDQPEAETKVEPPDPSCRLVAAPPEKTVTIEAMPETAADQFLAFTCCWPELEKPVPLPQPTQETAPLAQPTQEPQAWLLALLPLGLYALWWIARPRRVLGAFCAKHAGRVAAAQPHPRAPPMHTGLDNSTLVMPRPEPQLTSLNTSGISSRRDIIDELEREIERITNSVQPPLRAAAPPPSVRAC